MHATKKINHHSNTESILKLTIHSQTIFHLQELIFCKRQRLGRCPKLGHTTLVVCLALIVLLPFIDYLQVNLFKLLYIHQSIGFLIPLSVMSQVTRINVFRSGAPLWITLSVSLSVSKSVTKSHFFKTFILQLIHFTDILIKYKIFWIKKKEYLVVK